MNKAIYILTAQSPVHAGGNEQLDVVDLPIQRERHTYFPKIEGSSLKGSIKSSYPDTSNRDKLFGKDSDKRDNASSLGISDAKILFFPVKSVNGIFGWVTCPAALSRFRRDAGDLINIPELEGKNLICKGSNLKIKGKGNVVLEEYNFKVKDDESLTNFAKTLSEVIYPDDKYWQAKFQKDLVLLEDNSFRDFVVNSTEVVTRIKIDQKSKTASDTGLFNVEYLPEDSIMYFTVSANPPPNYDLKANKVLELFEENSPKLFQLGADLTLGKGLMAMKKVESKKGSE